MTAGDQACLCFSSFAQGGRLALFPFREAQRNQDEIRVCALKELHYVRRTMQIKQESDATRETMAMVHMSAKKLYHTFVGVVHNICLLFHNICLFPVLSGRTGNA